VRYKTRKEHADFAKRMKIRRREERWQDCKETAEKVTFSAGTLAAQRR
jgi:hypothetical protein